MDAKLDHVKSLHSKEVEEEEFGNRDSSVKYFPFTEHYELGESALQVLMFSRVLWNWYWLPQQGQTLK